MTGPTAHVDGVPVTGIEIDGVARFLGLRYAAVPPGHGNLSPAVPTRYDHPIEALKHGYAAPQPRSVWLPEDVMISTDCLYLNVWTESDVETPRPVLLWVHGGGFVGGTSSTHEVDGAWLARATTAVVVTVNYRLGYQGFGFYESSDSSPATSNLALRDIVEALTWIRRNIASFGGDPGRVTVIGHSAGAFLVSALPAAPSARTLFSGLVLMSGGPWRVQQPRDAALTTARLFEAARLNTVAELGQRDWREIVAAQEEIRGDLHSVFSNPPAGFAVVDDSALNSGVLGRTPLEAIRATTLPVLLTVTADEVAGLRDAMPPDTSGADEMRMTENMYHLPAHRTAVAAGGASWVGVIRDPDAAQESPHGMEVPRLIGDGPRDEIALQLARALRSFASDGDPGWTRYGDGRRPVQILDGHGREHDHYFDPAIGRGAAE